tara:strand:- start:395 stop:610 length:216 start_codon:yes stop_codon:yes gene_type:complete
VNFGLVVGAIVGAAIPIVATIATGGVAAVSLPLWIALGGAVSGLFAGNVEVKSRVERVLEDEARRVANDGE